MFIERKCQRFVMYFSIRTTWFCMHHPWIENEGISSRAKKNLCSLHNIVLHFHSANILNGHYEIFEWKELRRQNKINPNMDGKTNAGLFFKQREQIGDKTSLSYSHVQYHTNAALSVRLSGVMIKKWRLKMTTIRLIGSELGRRARDPSFRLFRVKEVAPAWIVCQNNKFAIETAQTGTEGENAGRARGMPPGKVAKREGLTFNG